MSLPRILNKSAGARSRSSSSQGRQQQSPLIAANNRVTNYQPVRNRKAPVPPSSNTSSQKALAAARDQRRGSEASFDSSAAPVVVVPHQVAPPKQQDLREELEEVFLQMRSRAPLPQLKERIDTVKIDVELKSLVSRIRGVATQIKERVRKQKELSESFIIDDDYISEDAPAQMLDVSSATGAAEVTVVLGSLRRPKSGNAWRGMRPEPLAGQYNSTLGQPCQPPQLIASPREQFHLPEIEQQSNGSSDRGEVLERVVQSLQAKHQAEKDALQVELQVFKAVIQGMAAKIRYLQDYKLDREQLQIQLFKNRHFNERLKKENAELVAENKALLRKLENMKHAMLAFDHSLLEERQDEDSLLEQLVTENTHLKKLLLIHENHGVLQEDIDTGLRQFEDIRNETAHSAKKSSLRGRRALQEDEMPGEIKALLEAKQIAKAHEKKVSQEIRRLAEEEITHITHLP